MDLELNGKVAIVGGASRGLGRACSEVLAEEGARVAMCARTPSVHWSRRPMRYAPPPER